MEPANDFTKEHPDVLWRIEEAGRNAKQQLGNCLALSDQVGALRLAFEELLKLKDHPQHQIRKAILSVDRALERVAKSIERCTRSPKVAFSKVHIELPLMFQQVTSSLIGRLRDVNNLLIQGGARTMVNIGEMMMQLDELEFLIETVDGSSRKEILKDLVTQLEILRQCESAVVTLDMQLGRANVRLKLKIHEEVRSEILELTSQLEYQMGTVNMMKALLQRSTWLDLRCAEKIGPELKEQREHVLKQVEVAQEVAGLIFQPDEPLCSSDSDSDSEIDDVIVMDNESDQVAERISSQMGESLRLRGLLRGPNERLEKRAIALVRDVAKDLRMQLCAQQESFQASKPLFDEALYHFDEKCSDAICDELLMQGAELQEQTKILMAIKCVFETGALPILGGNPGEWKKLRKEIMAQQKAVRKQGNVLKALELHVREEMACQERATVEDTARLLMKLQDESKIFVKLSVEALAILHHCIADMERNSGARVLQIEAGMQSLRFQTQSQSEETASISSCTAADNGHWEPALARFVTSIWYGTGPDIEASAEALLKVCACGDFGPLPQQEQDEKGPMWTRGLVSALLSDSNSVQAAAASAIGCLANTIQTELLKAKAPKILVTVIREGLTNTQLRAVLALGRLLDSDIAREQAHSLGAVELVVSLLQYQSPQARAAAAFTLKSFAFNDPPCDSPLLQKIRCDMIRSNVVPLLISHLKGGNPEGRAHALGALGGLAQSPRSIVAINVREVVPHVVPFLRSDFPDEQFYAVATLACFNQSVDEVQALVRQNAVPDLVEVLRNGVERSKFCAAAALHCVANLPDRDYREFIVSYGPVRPLITLLAEGTILDVQLMALETLRSLSANASIRQTVIQQGALAPILKLLSKVEKDDSMSRATIALALATLARDKLAANFLLAAKAGQLLVDLLSDFTADEELCVELVASIRLQASASPDMAEQMNKGGVQHLLLPMLNSSCAALATGAAAALKWL